MAITVTPKRLIGPMNVKLTDTTLMTATGAWKTIITSLHISNRTSKKTLCTIYIGSAQAAAVWLENTAIQAQDSFDWEGQLVLEPTESIHATATQSLAIYVTASGVLLTK